MSEVEWLSIGPTAERFGIKVPRLRTWCDKGLIQFDNRSTGRWIPSTEFPKIEKIKEIFARGGNITFEDVKEELIKDNLLTQLRVNEDEEKKTEEMALLLNKAFEKSGAGEFFMTVANEFGTMKKEIERLSQLVDVQNQQQLKLLEDNSKLDKLQEDNSALKGLVKDLISSDKDMKESFTLFVQEQREADKKKQDELEAKLHLIEAQLNAKNEEKKGFFARLFG